MQTYMLTHIYVLGKSAQNQRILRGLIRLKSHCGSESVLK